MMSDKKQPQTLTWIAGRATEPDPIITLDNLPRRLALTATCLLFSRKTPRQLLLCNPHPDTWKTWMLPYGAATSDLSESTFHAGMTKADVERFARERTTSQPSVAALIAEMLAMGGVSEETQLSNFTEIFEVKFSMSAGIWTLYYFQYYVGLVDHAAPRVDYRWLPIVGGKQLATSLRDEAAKAGLNVQPNVFEALNALKAVPNPT